VGGDLAKEIDPHPRSLSLAQWHQRYQQQAAWTQDVREYLFSRLNLHTEDQVLEVGSGTGALLSQVAKTHAVHLWGIDLDCSALLFTKKHGSNFHLAQANGYRLPFPSECFTMTYCHFLLLWLDQPGKMLEEMGRVTRPGGAVIALAEPDHLSRIDYPPPLDQLGTLQTSSLKKQGVDIEIGRRLSMLFHQSGFSRVESGVLGAQWSTKFMDENDETEWMMIRSDLDGTLSEKEIAQYQQIDRQARQNGTRVLFIPTFYAVGFVK
jgi:SAM-dependent methyltransferase